MNYMNNLRMKKYHTGRRHAVHSVVSNVFVPTTNLSNVPHGCSENGQYNSHTLTFQHTGTGVGLTLGPGKKKQMMMCRMKTFVFKINLFYEKNAILYVNFSKSILDPVPPISCTDTR